MKIDDRKHIAIMYINEFVQDSTVKGICNGCGAHTFLTSNKKNFLAIHSSFCVSFTMVQNFLISVEHDLENRYDPLVGGVEELEEADMMSLDHQEFAEAIRVQEKECEIAEHNQTISHRYLNYENYTILAFYPTFPNQTPVGTPTGTPNGTPNAKKPTMNLRKK